MAAKYLWNAAAIAVVVAGSRRSDGCADAPAEQSLSWRLSLTGGRLDDRRDTCTRADMNVSISFVLLSIVVAKMCLRTVPDPIAGRGPRAHQTPFQPPRLLQGGLPPERLPLSDAGASRPEGKGGSVSH